jgi:cytochrome c
VRRLVTRLALTLGLAAVAATMVAATGCSNQRNGVAGGDADRGKAMLVEFGCGTCHTVAGVNSAHGRVGPPLTGFAGRHYIAGELPNTAPNLVRFLLDPPAVEPGTAMPDMNVPVSAARDIAAYLEARRTGG